MASEKLNKGSILQIVGPVVDVVFESGDLPNVYDALYASDLDLTFEVQQLLGDRKVRAIALGATEGLSRGLLVESTGKPVQVPVGKAVLGRVFDVCGRVIDGGPPLDKKVEKRSIHQDPPAQTDLKVETSLLITGIKVIDLLCPFAAGGKIGLFGGAGAWTGEFGMMSFGAAAAAGSSIFGGPIEACAGAPVGLRSLGISGAGAIGSIGVGMTRGRTIWASV